MSTFIVSYIGVVILLFAVVNILISRKKKQKSLTQTPSIPSETSIKEIAQEIETQEFHLETPFVNDAVNEELAHRVEELEGIKPKTSIETSTLIKTVCAVMLGAFMAILNQTLINIALPHIMNDFGVAATTSQWLVTGYMLVNGIMIPITPFLIAKFSNKRLFLTAMFLFATGAILCAIAPSFSVMLTGRLVQASGAGIIMPLMMVMMLDIFPPEKRGMAMSLVGLAMMFAPAIGPTLSGYILVHFSWRVLFSSVLPVTILDIILAFIWIKSEPKHGNPVLDFIGCVFSTIGFGFTLYGFSEAGSHGWGSNLVISSLVVGVIFIILFIWRCLTAEYPVVNIRVFKYPVFALTTLIGSIVNMAMFSAMILLPVYLQNIRGFTPLDSGLLMLPGALVMMFMMPVAGFIYDKIGAKLLVIVGLSILIITTWEFSQLTSDTSYGHLMLLYVERMFGMSLIMMTLTTEGISELPRHLYSHGTAANNTARQVAASLGTAFLVTVMSNRAAFHTAEYANNITSTNFAVMDQVAKLQHVLPNNVVTQMLYGMVVKQSTIEGINDAFIVATGLAILSLLISFFIKGKKKASTS